MLNFRADHYFHIGSTHFRAGKPCQDYALSQSFEDTASVVVSDGCSSGRETDVGARILALATLQVLRTSFLESSEESIQDVVRSQKRVLESMQDHLGLQKVDMLATCVYAHADQRGAFVHIQGDGVVAIKFRNQDISMMRTDWSGNAPFYPVYNESDADIFRAASAERSMIQFFDSFEGSNREDTSVASFEEAQKGIVLKYDPDELQRIEFIAVFSDGVTQIENVDWRDAVKELLGFKSVAGEFAKRRMIRAIKDFQQLGKGPLDDISYAVIRIEHTQASAEESATHASTD